jgi:acyl-homoserine lactone acylase PvdQ
MRNILWIICVFLILMAPAVEAKRPPKIPGLRTAVFVLRDIEGIPHIIASNEHDMVMMQGWVHARGPAVSDGFLAAPGERNPGRNARGVGA